MMMTEENNWVVHQSFRTTEAEDELIRQKMKVFGIRSVLSVSNPGTISWCRKSSK